MWWATVGDSIHPANELFFKCWTSVVKWNELGFRPPLCRPTYRPRLNWARRTSWGWWDEGHEWMTLPSRHRIWILISRGLMPNMLPFGHNRLPTILNLHEWAGKKHFFFKLGRPVEWGSNPRTFQAGSFNNHCTPAGLASQTVVWINIDPTFVQCLVFAGQRLGTDGALM